MRWKFEVGDRVQRHVNVYDRSSKLMRGVVVRRYADNYSRYGPYPELYEVEWDCGHNQEGFLPHGLQAEAGRMTEEERMHKRGGA